MGEVSALVPLLAGSTQWALKTSSLIAPWKAEERKKAFLPYMWQSLTLANHRVSKNWCHDPLQRKEQDVLQNLRICFPHTPFVSEPWLPVSPLWSSRYGRRASVPGNRWKDLFWSVAGKFWLCVAPWFHVSRAYNDPWTQTKSIYKLTGAHHLSMVFNLHYASESSARLVQFVGSLLQSTFISRSRGSPENGYF